MKQNTHFHAHLGEAHTATPSVRCVLLVWSSDLVCGFKQSGVFSYSDSYPREGGDVSTERPSSVCMFDSVSAEPFFSVCVRKCSRVCLYVLVFVRVCVLILRGGWEPGRYH